MHATRRDAAKSIEALAAQGDWDAAYRQCVLWDFATEARMGFQMAFLRPFAVPRMADVLVASGRVHADPERRSYRTGLLMHEIIYDGLNGDRARQAIARINRAHRFPGIEPQDMTYVLAAFIVVPTRYIERVGWRPMLTVEREAAVRFYQRLGELLAIKEIPATYQEAAEVLDAYEAVMVRPSAATRALGHEVLTVLQRRLPGPLRPLAGPLFASQLRDPRLLDALGIPSGPRPIGQVIDLALHLRASITRHCPAPSQPSFTPGQPAGRVFADGYNLSDLTTP